MVGLQLLTAEKVSRRLWRRPWRRPGCLARRTAGGCRRVLTQAKVPGSDSRWGGGVGSRVASSGRVAYRCLAAGEASHVPSGIPVLLFWQSPARPRVRDTVRACAELHQTTHFAVGGSGEESLGGRGGGGGGRGRPEQWYTAPAAVCCSCVTGGGPAARTINYHCHVVSPTQAAEE